MNFQIEVNRFDELRAALKKMATPGHIHTAVRPAAEMAGFTATSMLRDNAPVGHNEPDYTVTRRDGTTFTVSHGRPSARLNLGTLSDQWGEPDLENLENGVSFTAISTAPHMKFILEGTRQHDIPKKVPGPMSFWWEKQGDYVTTPWNLLQSFHKDPQKPSDFVERTLAGSLTNEIATQLDTGISNILTPLRNFYKA